MLDTTFDHAKAEARLYEAWERSGAFRPKDDPAAEPYCIMIPPPNVTGTLHMGHALNNTLQDVLVRFERMRGKAVLWQVGTDHAGIATQMVVERQLAQGGMNLSRRDLGREEFLKRVWAWKEQSGGQISNQLRRLGASCDWSRERFTMDEGLSAAVRTVFVGLYNAGLLYRDKRLVNWDPHFETAISDLEVENIEVQGSMWRIAYPLADGSGEVIVATTRPETMLGDLAVGVHPKDERYAHLVGRMVRLPLVGREIPIIADEYFDPDKGTGCVKITPAHDFNDFKVGRRHGLGLLNIFDSRARLNEHAPAAYRGLDRYAARTRILAELEAQGLLRGEDRQTMTQPHGDRSGVVIEPWLTDQWYVDAQTLAARAIAAVETGDTIFVPKNWEKTYFEWLRNIEPWCVSRQLWWGHRIPAWYAPDGSVFVAHSLAEAQAGARAKFGADVALVQDEDVLDTWFSSGLWPFSTLGWPQETPEYHRFYPTSVLVTGFDIIFFWVARMMMLGLQFTDKVPFSTVYIHALVRDERGQKMSKSKGNVIDPLELIDAYGADALRFTLASMAAQGRDIKLARQRVEGYRNFGTKLWNAARFTQMNECTLWDAFDPADVKETVNRWIVSEAVTAARAVSAGLEALRFNEAAGAIYDFTWGVYCDWYLELIKPILNGDDEAAKAETRRTAAWTLDQILKVLHPFMPFVTEELWGRLSEFGPARKRLLINEPWPVYPDSLLHPDAASEIDWVIRLISEVRSTRAEMNVPAGAKIPLLLVGADPESGLRLERYQAEIDRLARLEYSTTASEAPPGAVVIAFEAASIALPIADVIDIASERTRLEKEYKRLAADIGKIEAKLANPEFLKRAPEEVVAEQHERLADTQATRAKVGAALARLDTISG